MNMTAQHIAKLIESNKYKLLGQIVVSDSEYSELIDFVSVKLENLHISTIPSADLMLSLALVQVAIRRYKDGRFWPCFEEEVGYKIPSNKTTYIGSIFDKTVKTYNLFLPPNDDGPNRYVEHIKAHAFITNYYMQGFYDFSYAYYENNLFRQLNTESIEEDFEDLSSFMATTLTNKNDNIVETGSNKAAKSYKLLKSTRTTFAMCDSKIIRNLFLPILKLVDNYFYDNVVPQVGKNRYEEAFIEWCRIQDSKSNQKSEKLNRIRKEFSHKPYINVNVDKELSYIVIPPQKFRDEDCNGYANAIIEINGFEENIELEVYKSFGIYITEEKQIPIPSIFDSVDITIKTLSEKKFHIPASNYRIFNRLWKNKIRFEVGANYILVQKNIPTRWENERDEIDSDDGFKNWNYYSAQINEESIFYVGNKPISIIGEFSPEPIFERKIEHFNVFDKNGKEIIVSREHPAVSFVVEKGKLNGSVLTVNSTKYPIENIKEKICYDWPEDKKKFAVSLPLNAILPKEDNKYDVVLDVPGEGDKNLCSYLLLRKFDCRFNKPRYTYDKTATLKITKGDCLFDVADELWEIESESEKSISYTIPLESSPESANLTLYLYDEYSVTMPIRIFKYGFSINSMKSQNVEYIWYSDLQEILYVTMPGAKRVSAYYGKLDMIKMQGTKVSEGIFRIDISEFIRHIKDSDKIYHYINLEYEDNAIRKLSLPVIYRTPLIKPYFKLLVENGIPFVDLTIKGDAKVFLKVEDYNGNILIDKKEMRNGKTLFPELSIDTFYKFSPYIEEGDKFGFSVKHTPLKEIENITPIDMENLEGCDIIVDNIAVNEKIVFPNYEYHIKLDKKQNDNSYLGFMYAYVIERDGKKSSFKKGDDNKKIREIIGMTSISYVFNDETMDFTASVFSNKTNQWIKPVYDNNLKKIHIIEPYETSNLKNGIFKENSVEKGRAYKQIPKMESQQRCFVCKYHLNRRTPSYVYAYDPKSNSNKIVKTNLFICDKCGIRYADVENYLEIRMNYPGYRAVPFVPRSTDQVCDILNKTKTFPIDFFPKVSHDNVISPTTNNNEKLEIVFIADKYKFRKYKEW